MLQLVRNTSAFCASATLAAWPFQRSSAGCCTARENEKVSARVSYNHRSDWLITPTGRGNLPELNEAFGSLDA